VILIPIPGSPYVHVDGQGVPEFQGIVDQIEEYLLNSRRIAGDRGRDPPGNGGA
jgi:hypothetical protein